jgi:FMN reductase (NADPH)
MNETLHQIHAHRSIRRFKEDSVPDAHIVEAVRAGQMASTSSAVQAYSVIRVRDAGKRAALAELSGPQEKVARCGAFLVICGDARRHRVICERAGAPYAETFESFLVAVIDASLLAQNMTLAFESLGYGVCYIGGIRNDLPRVRELLGMPVGIYPLFGLCVGLPDEAPGPRPRLPAGAVLFDDAYPTDAALLEGVDAYDASYREYLVARGAPKVAGWSEAMAARGHEKARADAGLFYASQGARLG